jgi:NADH:ubiquinone oxidoreductase subunit C
MTDSAEVLDALRRVCAGEALDQEMGARGEVFVRISAKNLLAAVRALMGQGVRHLSAITAQNVDGGVQVLYHFWRNGGLTLRVLCASDSMALDSLVELIRGADWYEREVHDLFGIGFRCHPQLTPLLLPDDWDQPPPFSSAKKEEQE